MWDAHAYKWAREKISVDGQHMQRIHPMITKLITISPHYLYEENPNTLINEPTANPRAWAIASDILRDYTDDIARATKGDAEVKTRATMQQYLLSPMVNTLIEGTVGIDGALGMKAMCTTVVEKSIDIVEPKNLLRMVMRNNAKEIGKYFDLLQDAQNDILGSYVEAIVSYIENHIKSYLNQDADLRDKRVSSMAYLTAGIAIALNSGEKVRPETKQVFITHVKDRLMHFYEEYSSDLQTMEALKDGMAALGAVGNWNKI